MTTNAGARLVTPINTAEKVGYTWWSADRDGDNGKNADTCIIRTFCGKLNCIFLHHHKLRHFLGPCFILMMIIQ